ncbi:MAG: hypothetical protein QOJ71_3121 [Actinomycetota bacterium]|nr:hypothetical protein [Actinomycetota bacterium]
MTSLTRLPSCLLSCNTIVPTRKQTPTNVNSRSGPPTLTYIKARYASDPSYLHINGKPVIFAYGDPATAARRPTVGIEGNSMGFLRPAEGLLRVFKRRVAAGLPASIPACVSTASKPVSSFSVRPGCYKANEATPKLAREPAAFAADVRGMIASNAPWQLVITFNEWGEGTSVESAQQWSSSSGNDMYRPSSRRPPLQTNVLFGRTALSLRTGPPSTRPAGRGTCLEVLLWKYACRQPSASARRRIAASPNVPR